MANNETYFSYFEHVLGWLSHFLVSVSGVPEIVHLVFNMELLAISSMSEVRSEDLLSDIFDSMSTSFMVV